MSAILEYPAWADAPPIGIDPVRESARLEDLRSLKLLDTEPEDRFDRITRLAARFFQIPTAYVAFIDSDRQWFKSRVGMCPPETTRQQSFCQYTIHRDEPLIIPSLDAETRFPAVTAMLMVSRSRSSPIRITSGSSRNAECSAAAKLGECTPISRWLIRHR